jgi:hypothetical protein
VSSNLGTVLQAELLEPALITATVRLYRHEDFSEYIWLYTVAIKVY